MIYWNPDTEYIFFTCIVVTREDVRLIWSMYPFSHICEETLYIPDTTILPCVSMNLGLIQAQLFDYIPLFYKTNVCFTFVYTANDKFDALSQI